MLGRKTIPALIAPAIIIASITGCANNNDGTPPQGMNMSNQARKDAIMQNPNLTDEQKKTAIKMNGLDASGSSTR